MKSIRTYMVGSGVLGTLVGGMAFFLVSLTALVSYSDWPTALSDDAPSFVDLPSSAGGSSSSDVADRERDGAVRLGGHRAGPVAAGAGGTGAGGAASAGGGSGANLVGGGGSDQGFGGGGRPGGGGGDSGGSGSGERPPVAEPPAAETPTPSVGAPANPTPATGSGEGAVAAGNSGNVPPGQIGNAGPPGQVERTNGAGDTVGEAVGNFGAVPPGQVGKD